MKTKWEVALTKKEPPKKRGLTRQFTLGENDKDLIDWLDAQAKKYECSVARVMKKILWAAMR